MYGLIRPLLFLFPAETAHHIGLFLARCVAPISGVLRRLVMPNCVRLEQELLGGKWAHPIGLAAGLDKDGRAAAGFAALASLRLRSARSLRMPSQATLARFFRLKADRAIINRFGFNNPGCEHAKTTLARHRLPCPLGGNIGKSKITANEDALSDYCLSVAALGPHVDYLVINVSSPNTPGLRDLQQLDALKPLIEGVQAAIGALERRPRSRSRSHLTAPTRTSRRSPSSPLRPSSTCHRDQHHDRARWVNRVTSSRRSDRRGRLERRAAPRPCPGGHGAACAPLQGRVPLISVGGIDSGEEVYRRIRLGASAVQIYSAVIYEGPLLAARMARELDRSLQRDGFSHVQQAIGVDL